MKYRNTIIIIVCGVILLSAYIYATRPKKEITLGDSVRTSQEDTQKNEQPVVETELDQKLVSPLADVNPEENYEVTRKAGLPYETDRYAITFKVAQSEPSGVRLIIIDKTQANGASDAIKNEANLYLLSKNIDRTGLKIDYKGLNDER